MLNPWKDRKQEAGPETEENVDEAPTDPSDEDAVRAAAGGAGRADEAPEPDAGNPDADSGSLESELAELKDRHLRLAAEFENFRKRSRKEASTGRSMAQAELLRQIIPTLDDLARVADTPHESTTVQALDEGIELILRNFRKQLGDAGLERIDALDQRFDPERHQAVMTTGAEDPELDETISRVLVDGYEFQGRLVRPAQVEVRRYEEPAAGEDEE